MMKSAPLVLCILAASALSPAFAAEGGVRLAPHRVVYDLSLAGSRGERGVEAARGRIAFEFTGNACEGYALKFRQVTVLDSGETGSKTSDLRTANFESGDGRSFRFRNDSRMNNGPSQTVDGTAEKRGDNPLAVKLTAPKRQSFSGPGDAVFPNAQMKDLIAAARAGKTTMAMKVFDGSDDGRKLYDTLAVIGHVEQGGEDKLEGPAQQNGLKGLRRWPVTMSYFNEGRGDQVPAYILSFDLYENGISRALKLDYGNFALKGEMTRLDLLPEKDCGK